jgi:predicted AlkP superfamily phosphohydrolase/phosphomutase
MKRRVIVFGLDGVSHPLAVQLAETGIMPTLAKLLRQGRAAPMQTEFPPLSPVCWTSFFTGANPGGHRIFGFYEPCVDTYGVWAQTLEQVKLPGLWDYAGEAGLRTICLNLPNTYPAPPLQGVLVSGFPVADWQKAAYPKNLTEILPQAGYSVDIDCALPEREPARFLEECERVLRARGHVFSSFLANEPFDLFLGIFTETDRLQHFFFDALEEENHPWRARVLGLFHLLDQQLEKCLTQVREEDDLWIVADHGFTRIQLEVCPNHWLEEHGWLVMQDPPGPDLENIDPAQTKAFCLDPGRIFLNLQGRQPEGCVSPEKRGEVLTELRQQLLAAKIRVPWSAEPICPWPVIHLREDIYHGPFVGLAADLLLEAAPGIDLKAMFHPPGISRLKHFTGMHSANDALCYRRAPDLLPETPHISGLLPHILQSLGLQK